MNAQDVMVRNVVTVGPDTDVTEAARLLAEHDISALPVVDSVGNLIGILSEADLLERKELGAERKHSRLVEAMLPASTLAAEFVKAHGRTVSDLMSTDVISAHEDTPIGEIATLLERHRIKRLPILRDGKIVGIVSRSNLIQAIASSRPASETVNGASDRTIRRELLDRLGRQPWTDFGSRNIIVRDGIVHLWGLVGSESERKALTALAREVPGVSGVADEMIPAY
jgi:CBS-domain-containing membrane protein